MKTSLAMAFIAWLSMSSTLLPPDQYNPAYVKVDSLMYKNIPFFVLSMNRQGSGKRIKAKYFSRGKSYMSVAERYNEWSVGRKVICVGSGGYSHNPDTRFSVPVGINVDNGVIVNRNLAAAACG